MEIVWLGHATFRLRGKDVTIITDPFGSMVGFKLPKVEAEIVTVSHQHEDHNQMTMVSGDPFVINSPGEYEVKGVSVFGVSTWHDDEKGAKRGKNTVFVVQVDGVKVCHLGDLGHKLTEEQVGQIEAIDVLLIPVGGYFTIGPKEAAEVVSLLEPSIVVPMHYKTDELSEQNFANLSGVDEFLNAMGVEKNVQSKLTLAADKLPQEMQVVVLERKQ